MKFFKKTYKYISAFTLILFLNTIALPAGMSAASLFCEMDMSAMSNSVHTCCDFHRADMPGAFTKEKDKESCTYLEVCPPILSKEHSDVQAIPQISKDVIVADLSEEFLYSPAENKRPGSFKVEPGSFHRSPPIFLLNNVFLN